ncbi:hypothetical protein [Luteolibacter sp. Populi]|uniref:hypothetical protein n=1 Tax=Luteolibacter sp. Populi TaxID=3230487 RepID=UPI003467D3C0
MSPKEVAPAARTSEEEPGLDFQSRLKLAEYFANGLSWFYLPDANAWPAMAERVPFLSSEKNRIERLREAFGEQVGWVVVEDQYIDRDYRDTFSHTFSKRFATPASRCQRIHFFAKEMGRSQKPDVNMKREELQESYLGYLVVRPTRPNGVGRTFLDPRIMKHEGFNLCLCGERITLFGKELQIEGFPFIGQDIDVTTCAQSTLWMIRRYYSNRYTQYSETHPNTLSKMAALRLREDRAFPATGLNDGQMAEMLRTMGYSPKVYCKDSFIHDEMRNNDRRIRTAKAQEEGREGKQIHFGEILLTYLESGIPLILSFKKGERYHSVACIGYCWSGSSLPNMEGSHRGECVKSDRSRATCLSDVDSDCSGRQFRTLPSG